MVDAMELRHSWHPHGRPPVLLQELGQAAAGSPRITCFRRAVFGNGDPYSVLTSLNDRHLRDVVGGALSAFSTLNLRKQVRPFWCGPSLHHCWGCRRC